ncbi:Hypothetical predicted protein [Paramuricea clavata]|uniref:Uncharacterized protein n=1 Tax=Paramuricea clavata TaxID=317549 RepID=A0A7D9DRK9_PARCT|nr:Hypothetical predicted protein [Paramuricea clavata]
MAHSINMLDLIKACEAESELDFLQESFVLTDEQKEAVHQQRIIFWTNAMAEDIERENPVGVVDGFMDNWTEDQRRLFNEVWANDDGLCELEQLPEPPENQMGEGSKRKHASDDAPSKRQRPEEYFTIKSAKQINVRKFRTTERFLAAIERVVQSNDQFTLDDFVSVNVVHMEMPNGAGRKRRDVVNLESYLTKKRGIVQVKNKDDLCCARAIVVAKAILDKDPQYKSIVSRTGTLQDRLAQELHESAGVSLGSCGIPEIKKFQAALPGYQLNVISKEHLNAMIYSGPEAEKHLYLYHHDNHFDVITSMPAFLARKQYCHKCKKGFDKITSHPCGDLCKLCHTQNCFLVEWKFCKDCNRFFKSDECFKRHKDDAGPAKSLCCALIKSPPRVASWQDAFNLDLLSDKNIEKYLFSNNKGNLKWYGDSVLLQELFDHLLQHQLIRSKPGGYCRKLEGDGFTIRWYSDNGTLTVSEAKEEKIKRYLQHILTKEPDSIIDMSVSHSDKHDIDGENLNVNDGVSQYETSLNHGNESDKTSIDSLSTILEEFKSVERRLDRKIDDIALDIRRIKEADNFKFPLSRD